MFVGNIVWVDFRSERYKRDALSWKERVERRSREFSGNSDLDRSSGNISTLREAEEGRPKLR